MPPVIYGINAHSVAINVSCILCRKRSTVVNEPEPHCPYCYGPVVPLGAKVTRARQQAVRNPEIVKSLRRERILNSNFPRWLQQDLIKANGL